MLHVANGASTAVLLRQAGLEGEVVDGDGIWMEGPWGVPPESRARELARRLGGPEEAYLAGGRESALAAALRAEEVTFWTEDDLFCQANLCEALRRFPPTHGAKVSLATPADPDERLGHLSPEGLARRFEARAPLTDACLRLAHRAADALASSDPRAVETLLGEDFSAWPALRAGLLAHLRRFPSTLDGLDSVERETLGILAREGPLSFPDLFAALQRAPRFWPLGMGDVQVMAQLRDLAPLVALDGAPGEPGRWRVSLSPQGRAFLSGEAAPAPPLDRWVGGVRLQGRHGWRWDETRKRLVAPDGNGSGASTGQATQTG